MLLFLILNITLYITAQLNYLLFHAIAEGFAIIVAALIFVLATRTFKHSKNRAFLYIGITYLHVGILDFFHLLSYKGMGVFVGMDSNPPTQLWIAGRYMEAIAFLTMPILLSKDLNRKLIFMIHSIITAVLISSIMIFQNFPSCFVEGKGLTNFKIVSEYIIVFMLFLGTYLLYLKRKDIGRNVYKNVSLAMIVTALSELSFTLYTDVYGIANMVGHMLKVLSYYFIYISVVTQGIDAPYSLISNELKNRAIKDDLTGLYNRQGLAEMVEARYYGLGRGNSIGLLMIDLDNFKQINDSYGHIFGDEVLKMVSNILKNSIRSNDIASRYGGDEFVIMAQGLDENGIKNLKERIYARIEGLRQENQKLGALGISIGSSRLEKGESLDLPYMIKAADKNMYAVKQKKQNSKKDQEIY